MRYVLIFKEITVSGSLVKTVSDLIIKTGSSECFKNM